MILTSLAPDGSTLIARCTECCRVENIEHHGCRGNQMLAHDSFVDAHAQCAIDPNEITCPKGDPGCDQPEDDPEDMPHCHDACERPASKAVQS